MDSSPYVVKGATGNIGRALAQALLAQGHKVRAIARSRDKLQELARLGAEIVSASVDDENAMLRAFSGARAAFILIPPNHAVENVRAYQNKVSKVLADA